MNRFGNSLSHFGGNEDLVRRLVDAGVEFVLIGGLAVAWYCPDREADDMDLLVNPTSENSSRIAGALDSLHLSGHAPDSFLKAGLQVPLKSVHYAELLTPQEDGPTYAEVAGSAVEAKVFNIPIRLASVEALIALKQRASVVDEAHRDKHLLDIERLQQVRTA